MHARACLRVGARVRVHGANVGEAWAEVKSPVFGEGVGGRQQPGSCFHQLLTTIVLTTTIGAARPWLSHIRATLETCVPQLSCITRSLEAESFRSDSPTQEFYFQRR